MKLAKYSVGTGDRFAHQAKAQLQACMQALARGVEVVPVWNKSNREHTIIDSEPASARQAADAAQSPAELLIILAAIADEGIPVQTIAPKFSGRFNKGVDYVGDTGQFEREMALDVAAIAYAVRQFGLPENLKLSVHSGSDKFSIYPVIHATIRRFDAGVHLKTAGTTWLEELIGLAEAGGDGLALAKEIYAEAFAHREELCVPYATVIDIDPAKLPSPAEVKGWSSEQYTSVLRHVEGAAAYNSSLRQLLHVGFKVAARMGNRYLGLLESNETVIAKNVTENLFSRHIAPVFLGRNAY